jgi:hypothetical protein
MDIAINIGVGLAGGLAGNIVALVIQIYASNRQIAKGPDVTGEWAAEYQAADLQNHPWMSETVIFWVRRGKLHFKTIRNQQDDPIKGNAELVGWDHIIGRWRQIDPRGIGHGVLVLTIEPGGRLLYGFWTGDTQTGERRFGGWIMARDPAHLDAARSLLSELTA